jgi:D-3-phosphoglycerate dehydrogenase
MAVIGLGDIGFAVAERAVAFGLHVHVLDRPDRDRRTQKRMDRLGLRRFDSMEELVSSSDIVSLHVPASDDTYGTVDATFLGWMRPGAVLLNTSRGDLVDEAALLAALDEKGLRAGLDVYADEPSKGKTEWTSRLAQHPSVVGTHHIGASTDQAQEAIAAETVRIVREFRQAGRAPNVVNLTKKSPATHLLVVRHYDRVGVLAAVFDRLKEAGINVQETENVVFDGAKAAVARIHLSSAPKPETVAAIRSSTDDILEVALLAL